MNSVHVTNRAGRELRWCSHCSNHLPVYRFHEGTTDGSWCKSCQKHYCSSPERRALNRSRTRMSSLDLAAQLRERLNAGKQIPKWLLKRIAVVVPRELAA